MRTTTTDFDDLYTLRSTEVSATLRWEITELRIYLEKYPIINVEVRVDGVTFATIRNEMDCSASHACRHNLCGSVSQFEARSRPDSILTLRTHYETESSQVYIEHYVKLWDLMRNDLKLKINSGKPGLDFATLELHAQVLEPSLPTTEFLLLEDTPEELPTQRHIRKSMSNLEKIWAVNHGAYNIVQAHIRSLWARLTSKFPDPSLYIEVKNVIDHEGQAADVNHLRYNAPEDLLVHVEAQLAFAVKCREAYQLNSVSARILSILVELMEEVAVAFGLIYATSDIYYGATYNTVGSNERRRYTLCHCMLLYHRAKILMLLKDADSTMVFTQPDEKHRKLFLSEVFGQSIGELRSGPNWPWNTFSAAILEVRGPPAQTILELMRQNLFVSEPKESAARDLLRRFMTHVVQLNDQTPNMLQVSPAKVSFSPRADGSIPTTAPPKDEGSYSTVYQGRLAVSDDPTLQYVAMKCLRFPNLGTSDERASRRSRLLLEIVHMATLKHENVLPLLGVTFKFGSITLLTPWMPNGNALEYMWSLKPKDFNDLTSQQLVLYYEKVVNLSSPLIGCIVDGLLYLHQEGIIHGDLRGVNVFIDKNGRAIVADFGLSVFAHGHINNYQSRRAGNQIWTAPEIIDVQTGRRERPTMPSDIYSFAMICVELHIHEGLDIPPGHARPLRPPHMVDGLWDLVQECWDDDKDRRPNAKVLRGRLRALGI